jgi:hypothetical protein
MLAIHCGIEEASGWEKMESERRAFGAEVYTDLGSEECSFLHHAAIMPSLIILLT